MIGQSKTSDSFLVNITNCIKHETHRQHEKKYRNVSNVHHATTETTHEKLAKLSECDIKQIETFTYEIWKQDELWQQ